MRYVRSFVYRFGFRPKPGSIFFSPSRAATLAMEDALHNTHFGDEVGTSTSHHVDKCPHGDVVTQCRCIGPKAERIVPCTVVCLRRHNEMLFADAPQYKGRHRLDSE